MCKHLIYNYVNIDDNSCSLRSCEYWAGDSIGEEIINISDFGQAIVNKIILRQTIVSSTVFYERLISNAQIRKKGRKIKYEVASIAIQITKGFAK